VRARAAKSLTQHLVETGVIKALAAAAEDGEVSVRVAAVAALGGMRPLPERDRTIRSIPPLSSRRWPTPTRRCG